MKQIIVDNQATDYWIAENGKCWSSKTNIFLKGQISNSGYLNYNLTLPDGSKKRFYTHRLVAEHFIQNDNEEKNQVNHKDGNKLNNNVENLEWMTTQENQQHAIKNNLRTFHTVYCFREDGSLFAKFSSMEEASKKMNVALCLILQETNSKVKSFIKGHYYSYDSVLGEVYHRQNLGVAKEVFCYKDGELYKTFRSTGEAARWLGVKRPNHIGECCRGKIKSYKGYTWKYADDIV